MLELTIGTADFEALAAEILGAGSALRFRARGISMEPFIYDGNIVEVQRAANWRVRRGDVVLARCGAGHLVVHRVVALSAGADRTLLIQGDALPRPDGRVSRDQVLGRASVVEKEAGRLNLDRGSGRWLGLMWVWSRPIASRLLRLSRSFRA